MTYTISEAAERCGLTAHTLRYYDKEGLLPYVDRAPSGTRLFKESDFGWLNTINCLKDTGMPIKKIKQFIDLSMEGDKHLDKRLAIMRAHKEDVERQLAELMDHMDTINFKLWYYEKTVAAGTELIFQSPEDAMAQYQKERPGAHLPPERDQQNSRTQEA